jgi:hypothetical protein
MQAWKTSSWRAEKSGLQGISCGCKSHIFEAFEIVQNEIEPSAEPKAAIEACDAQTARGGGSMAQLNLPELGGTGQWMRGWSATCSTIP